MVNPPHPTTEMKHTRRRVYQQIGARKSRFSILQGFLCLFICFHERNIRFPCHFIIKWPNSTGCLKDFGRNSNENCCLKRRWTCWLYFHAKFGKIWRIFGIAGREWGILQLCCDNAVMIVVAWQMFILWCYSHSERERERDLKYGICMWCVFVLWKGRVVCITDLIPRYIPLVSLCLSFLNILPSILAC